MDNRENLFTRKEKIVGYVSVIFVILFFTFIINFIITLSIQELLLVFDVGKCIFYLSLDSF